MDFDDNNFLETNIKRLKNWECVLNRPAMYLGKKSIYGFECFICGLFCAKSNFFFDEADELFYFENWVRNKFQEKDTTKRSFDIARREANQDDEKAFDIWADWFREFKS